MMKFAEQEEIKYAHSVLLSGKPFFEDDKIDIIECNESRDIKACPGSGKTTTLLAKLIILANRMPLPNNQGICVLTHTNVAIDEIKSKLGHKADILFKYPNHFGTIQSFVDKFLAIPSLKTYHNTALQRVDSDIANKLLLSEFLKLEQYKDKLHTFLYMRFYENSNEITEDEINSWKDKLHIPSLKQDLINLGILVEKGKKVKKIFLDSKKSSWKELSKAISNRNICSSIYEKRKEINKQIDIQKKELISTLRLDYVQKNINKDALNFSFSCEAGKSFLQIKENVFKKGFLNFNDAYSLAFKYCNNLNDNLQAAISSRFKYLFIDEMQDTDKQQIELIKNIFDREKTVIQHFGDHRQAIYNNKVNAEEQWNPQNFLPINNSKRFGESIANVLRYVCIEKNENLTANSAIASLTPVMIVFDNPETVIPKFCELIRIRKIGGKTILDIAKDGKKSGNTSHKIKAIGWVGTENTPDKHTIKSYFTNFNAHIRKKEKVDFGSLKSFLKKQDGAKVADYANIIIDALLYILSSANIKYSKGKSNRNYTKTTLLEDFEKKSPEKFSLFKTNLARWAMNIQNSDAFCNQTNTEIKLFIRSEFCTSFGIDSTNKYVNDFIDSDSVNTCTDEEIKSNNRD